MANEYTPNKLIQIIYGEAPLQEYFALDDAMNADPALRSEFRQLYDGYKMLQNLSLAPSSKSIEKILSSI